MVKKIVYSMIYFLFGTSSILAMNTHQEIVVLRNDTTQALVSVKSTLSKLESLFEKHPEALYDLVMKARNSTYQLSGNSPAILKKALLLDNNEQIQDPIRNVVASAGDGNGVDMMLVDPTKENRFNTEPFCILPRSKKVLRLY